MPVPRSKDRTAGIRRHPHRAKYLHRPVENTGLQPGGDDLDGGNIHPGCCISFAVHLVRRLEHQQSCLIDLKSGFGDPILDVGEVREMLAEGFAFKCAFAH